MIENLEREKKMLSDNLLARQEIITNYSFCATQENINSDIDPLVDLNEPYNAEAEAAWKGKLFFDKSKIITSYLYIY